MCTCITVIYIHAYIPAEFMKTIIVPLVKNKSGDIFVNNFGPIALVTVRGIPFDS